MAELSRLYSQDDDKMKGGEWCIDTLMRNDDDDEIDDL